MVKYTTARQTIWDTYQITPDKNGTLLTPLYPAGDMAQEGLAIITTHALSMVASRKEVFRADPAANAVNFPLATASAAGSPAIIGAEGADTDIDLLLNPKGAGLVKFPLATTGAGTALLGTNCPASTLTAPYAWLKVRLAGSTGYLPLWR